MIFISAAVQSKIKMLNDLLWVSLYSINQINKVLIKKTKTNKKGIKNKKAKIESCD